MKSLSTILVSVTLACGALVCVAQQERNPNQQQQQTGPKNQAPPDNPGQNAPPSDSNGDIPKEKPGTNNPDIAPDAKPATGNTAPEGKTKKGRHRKSTSSSTHTAPTV